jgi:hypothetical protein
MLGFFRNWEKGLLVSWPTYLQNHQCKELVNIKLWVLYKWKYSNLRLEFNFHFILLMWLSKHLWQWFIYYRNTVLDIFHFRSWYTWRLGSWFYSHLQLIGCHCTDSFVISDSGWDRTWDLLSSKLVH